MLDQAGQREMTNLASPEVNLKGKTMQQLISRLTGASCCQCGGAWGGPWGGSYASVTSPSPLQSHINTSQ